MADGDGVEELGLAEPVPALDQIGSKKGEQYVAAAIENGAHLQEKQKLGSQRHRYCADGD